MGQTLRTVGGRPALPVCACVSLVFCSLASVLPAFVVPVGSCGVPVALLYCVAAFAVPACVVFSIRLSGTVPRTCKIFGQSTGVLYLGTQVKRFSEGGRKKDVSNYNENAAACGRHPPVACWMLPCGKRSCRAAWAHNLWSAWDRPGSQTPRRSCGSALDPRFWVG